MMTILLPRFSPALRSDQLDVSIIDDELHTLLLPHIKKIFDHYPEVVSNYLSNENVMPIVKSVSFLSTIACGIPSPAMLSLGLNLSLPLKRTSNKNSIQLRMCILFTLSILLPSLCP